MELFYMVVLMSDSSSVSDSSVEPAVWVQGSRNVVSSIYSPDGSIHVDSTDPTRIGLSATFRPISMAVVRTISSGSYALMVSTCANLTYNGYTGWKLADAHEVIYVCQKGLIYCSSTSVFETAEIYHDNYNFRTVAVYGGSTIYPGSVTEAPANRTFVCVR